MALSTEEIHMKFRCYVTMNKGKNPTVETFEKYHMVYDNLVADFGLPVSKDDRDLANDCVAFE